MSIWKKTSPKEIKDNKELESPVKTNQAQYERDEVIEDYRKFHFDMADKYGVANFPKAIADYVLAICQKHNIA